MTAHAAQDDRDRCLAAGMDGYLCKPIQREELIATVERLADEGITDERLGIGGDCKFHISNPKSQIEDPAPPRFISHPSSLIPKPSSFTPASPFNLDRALARLGGKLGLFREMAGYFFSDAVKLLPEILAAAAAGDATAIGKRAHQLKGTLLYLGADAAVEAVTRVETISHSGNLADATVAIRSMENELTRLAAALRPYGPENDQKQIEMPDREEHNTPTHSSGAP